MRNRMAFTIVETTVVIALIGALTAITIPRAAGFIDSIQVRGAVTESSRCFRWLVILQLPADLKSR